MPGRAARVFPFVCAAVAWLGAWLPLGAPTWVAVIVLLIAIVVRRRAVVLVAVGVAASVLAANAIAGTASLPSGAWRGTVTLVADPIERSGGTSVDVRADGGRLELTAWGPAGRVLLGRSAGERVEVEGALSPLRDRRRSTWRHVRARLVATRLVVAGGTDWWMVVPNAIRDAVLAGATPLPVEQRPVYSGFVLGDDRGRSERVTRWFEAAGLLHLLVVSGENVVFVMVVLGPLLTRFPRRSRFALTGVVLLTFAAMTRFEPSVLRATVMATIAAGAIVAGRPTDGRRTLAIAVTVLVLVDPLLVRSMGFVLSVVASAGIVLLAPPIERRLRGPRRLRTVLAVTIAAQLAVAPVIVPIFGPMPLLAVPANILAEPVAGLVMMWGSTAGIVAGVAGGPIAVLLQWPTRIGLWWIIGVARTVDGLPDLDLDLVGMVTAVLVVLVLERIVRRRRGRRRRAVGPRTGLPIP